MENGFYGFPGGAVPPSGATGGAGKTPTLILDYVAATDIANSLAVPISTWTDIGTNQTFTHASASSLVEIIVTGFVYASSSGGGSRVRARVLVDSAGTPVSKPLGGGECSTTFLNNVLGSGGSVYLSGLSAAAHTVKVQVYTPDSALTAYCRASTQGPVEGLNIQVIEHQ